ncbi:MAG: helix-turn-helix domain-containing protein [Opitutaceae bacterium]|nr:helix-turn-helix domain-containing protein [Opitutaceae bacterium]
MDSLITAAAQALAAGDPLGALNRVALRDDAPALALRGIALAQIGDFARARALVRRAARAFGGREPVSRARCIVAESEIALASRDIARPAATLEAAHKTLAEHGDRLNAAHARHLEIRRLVLIGRLDDAERALAQLDATPFPPAWRATHEMVVAGIALRRLRARTARAALGRARGAAHYAGIPALIAEIERTTAALDEPAARLLTRDGERLLRIDEVEALQQAPALVVDACRHGVRDTTKVIRMDRRPVLFALARALGEAWPGDVTREELIARAFAGRRADESHRARLRVEIARLRSALRPLAGVAATPRGFQLLPLRGRDVVVLAPPIEGQHGAVLALLADGEAWSSSALALALGTSQRTMQRSLDSLAAVGKVHGFGRARARRWMAPPPPGFTTSLLLPSILPTG